MFKRLIQVVVNAYLVFENLRLLSPQLFLLEGKKEKMREKSICFHCANIMKITTD